MYKLKEKDLGDNFESFLNSTSSHLPTFNHVFRELPAYKGIPDFIAVNNRLDDEDILQLLKCITPNNQSYLYILSMLLKHKVCNEKFLIDNSNYKIESIDRALKYLVEEKIVNVDLGKNYYLSKNWDVPKLEIWAFELKLQDWRKALFQSMKNKSFATKVINVFPLKMKELLQKNIIDFKELGIGILLFDNNNNFEVLLPPKKNTPYSYKQYLFICSQISYALL